MIYSGYFLIYLHAKLLVEPIKDQSESKVVPAPDSGLKHSFVTIEGAN